MTRAEGEEAEREAAEWLARLQNRSISTAELAQFAEWRRNPDNDAAYERAQAIWDQSGRLFNDPDIQRALHADKRAAVRDRPLASLAVVIVSIVMVLALAGGYALFAGPRSNSYQTAVGERSTIRLPDGSGVQLDTASAVATRYSDDERRLTLTEGQAFFEVAHEPGRPFVVDAGHGVTITAIGTAFDVRRTSEKVVVALAEGSVVVRRGSDELARMGAGSVLEIPRANDPIQLARSPADVSSWRTGRVTFRETPLVDAVGEINRYTDRPLHIEREVLRGEPISGEFSTDDPEGFQRAVNALIGEEVVTRAK